MSHRLPDNPEKGGQPPFSAEHNGRGHEVHDVRPRGLLIFAILFLAGLGVILAIGLIYFRSLHNRIETDSRIVHAAPPVARFGIVPPMPGVQPEPFRPQMPYEELAEVRSREAAMLGSDAKGWVDSDHHFARISLEHAIDLAVRDGLPMKLPATQPTTQPFMPPASAVHGPEGVP